MVLKLLSLGLGLGLEPQSLGLGLGLGLGEESLESKSGRQYLTTAMNSRTMRTLMTDFNFHMKLKLSIRE